MSVDYLVEKVPPEEEMTCERCGKKIRERWCTLVLDCGEGKSLYYIPSEESKEIAVNICEDCATEISQIIKKWLKNKKGKK